MKSILFVFHEKAGRGSLKAHLPRIYEVAAENGYEVTMKKTEYAGHATELVRTYAEGYDIVLCSGGDGTLNEVANGMIDVKKEVPILFIPAGTANDMGYNLGISRKIPERIEQLFQGKRFRCDAGKLNGKLFMYVAAFGSPMKISYSTPQSQKNVWGYAAYVVSLLKELPKIQTYHLKITNDRERIEGEYLVGFIANSFSISSFHGVMGKHVSLNDGVFEVLLIKNIQIPLQIPAVLKSIMTEEVRDNKYIERFTTRGLTIESDKELPWCIDGENGGNHLESKIEVFQNAITFII